MNFVVQELYESVLITEMNQKVVDYLNQHTDKLPFDHIFGDKMRVAFPIGTDITAQSIIDDLKRIQHFDKVDLKSGEVVRKIKLDPKYGQGDYKEQKINMGKAISALKIAEDKKKSYLDWFARYKDNLEAAFEKPEFIVILSRAPIDVVRMSDHRNISSCHSQGGGYFQCAIQEAISGGAIAYVVKEEDFAELSEEQFQMKEIFVDSDRGHSGIYGLRPLARLRVRRLEDDDENEVAIPDTKIYGDKTIPNFYTSLVNYLKRKQSTTTEDFSSNVYTKRGGTYYDDDIRDLIANYFSNDEDKYYSSNFTRIKHNRDDESGENEHAMIGIEEELEEYRIYYNDRMEYSEVYFYVYDEGGGFSQSAITTMDVTRFNLPEDFENQFDNMYKLKRGEYDNDYEWSLLYEFFDGKIYKNIYEIEVSPTEIKITFDSQESRNDPDDFRSFCREIENFDDKIEDILEDVDELQQTLLDAGFLKEAPSGDPEYSMISKYIMSEEEWFDNFTIKGSKPMKSFTVESRNDILLGPSGHDNDYDISDNLSFQVGHIINNLARENFKPKTDEEDVAQLQFNKFFESYTNVLEGIDFSPYVKVVVNWNRQLVIDTFQLKFNKMDNKNFEFVQFLDDMFPHILNALRLYCLGSIKRTNPDIFNSFIKKVNYYGLIKVYQKYL